METLWNCPVCGGVNKEFATRTTGKQNCSATCTTCGLQIRARNRKEVIQLWNQQPQDAKKMETLEKENKRLANLNAKLVKVATLAAGLNQVRYSSGPVVMLRKMAQDAVRLAKGL